MNERTMDEKIEDSVVGGDDEPMTPDALIAKIGKQMRAYAAMHLSLTKDDCAPQAKSGKFSHLLHTSYMWTIHMMLTVSPAADETDPALFWHASMSIVSRVTSRPKTVGLWTVAERRKVTDLLPALLGDAGDVATQEFIKTTSALHCTRRLTADELARIRG